ncbi:ATP-binding protein [Microbacterium sp. GXS0129]|uniref:ATP-binding protein n=1 Tax=Microbacterium sp. GXS0129 TaxID=3377836 RepID=UPI00383B85DA
MRRATGLRTQLLAVQSAIMLVVIVGTGVTVALVQGQQVRDSYRDRMIAVAQSVASLPAVLDAFDDSDPSAIIQPIAELVRAASDVDYVVVTDADGIRFSHPDPDRIGEVASTPLDALDGSMYVGTQTGTLGTSWRVKIPVRAADDTIIGQVSVGILETDLHSAYLVNIGWLALALAVAAVIGALLSSATTSFVHRRLYGVEPDEIKRMLDTRDATLHGIGDGIVVLDPHRRVVLCNDAALRLLDRSEESSLVGLPIRELLDVDLDQPDADSGPQQLALAGERILLARVDPVIVDGRRVGTVIILMDRTELDTALRELAGAQSIAEALRAQQHEFANTLHTIGGLLELGEHDAASSFIERASGDDADSGGLPADLHDVEVAALLIAKRARAREAGVRFEVRCRGTVSAAGEHSRDRITVIGNLVDNAIEAAGRDGTVEVALEEDSSGALLITVDDDGPGIAPDRRDDVFSLEHTSKGSHGGLPRGYGLTLVSRVTRRAGGGVVVSDSSLGGARFEVRLPRSTAVVANT